MQAIRRPRLALDCCATRPDNVGSPTSLPQRAPRSDKILQRVQPSLQRVARGVLHTLAAVAVAATLAQPAQAKQSPEVLSDTLGTIAVQQLPNEAQQTLQRIEAGGPYPYAKDGSRFGNYERILPRRPRGYYREYTVARPGSRNRGAKRIVCGGEQRAANDCYYTEDHYNSFKRIIR